MEKMTLSIFGMILAAPLLIAVAPAHAQNYPWCAQKFDGARSCGFVSYEQCIAVAQRGSCERNYLYQPPTGTSQAGRTPRRR